MPVVADRLVSLQTVDRIQLDFWKLIAHDGQYERLKDRTQTTQGTTKCCLYLKILLRQLIDWMISIAPLRKLIIIYAIQSRKSFISTPNDRFQY